MIDLDALNETQLRQVAAAALWSHAVLAETPEGHDFWSQVVKSLEDGIDTSSDEYRALVETLPGWDRPVANPLFNAELAGVAADALAKLGGYVYALAALRARLAVEAPPLDVPSFTTVAPPRIIDFS